MKQNNAIRSDSKRRAFQKRFLDRLQDECILTELIGAGSDPLTAESIQEEAVNILRTKSDEEILVLIGNSVPARGVAMLSDMRSYSVRLVSKSDQKLLPAPTTTEPPLVVGRRTRSVLSRIAWRSLCSEDSQLYKLWSKKMPAVFDGGYFAAAIYTTMADWRIGIGQLAAGIVAHVMKSTAEEFCEIERPKSLMASRVDSADDERTP